MASKILLLLILFAVMITTTIAAAEANPLLPAEPTPADAEKAIGAVGQKMKKVFEALYADAPPAKKEEIEKATTTQYTIALFTIGNATASGDEKKALSIARSYEIAVDKVIAAPPAEKLQVMEDAFNAVSAPNPAECPGVDKPYCETLPKIQKALDEVVVAAPSPAKKVAASTLFAEAIRNINMAYAFAGKRSIDATLAAYGKAADAVLAAAPAEKSKVMEETFAGIAAAARPFAGIAAAARRPGAV